MIITCELCNVKCRNVFDWNSHLISNRHQELAELNICSVSAEMKDRTLVAWDFHDIISENQLIDHFSEFGLVHDIYFDRSAVNKAVKACVVLMDSRSVVTTVLSCSSGKTVIARRRVTCKRRNDLTPKEWNKIIKNPKEEIFLANHNALTERMKDEPLAEQLSQFINETTLNEEQTSSRYRVLKEIEQLLKKDYPYCTLQPFGSFLSGISSRDGDIDVFLDINGLRKGNNDVRQDFDPQIIVQRLREAGKYIQNSVDERRTFFKLCSTVLPLLYTRIPIIRFIHREADLQVDLSFNSSLSVQNSKLIKFYIEYDPRVRPLFILIRHWGRFHHLTGSDKIKNYALMLMVIVYLNQKKILPNVHFLQTQCGAEAYTIDGWNGGFNDNVDNVKTLVAKCNLGSCANSISWEELEKIGSTWTILDLARDFFKMYATMDIEKSIVCPFLGIQLEKEFFYEGNVDLTEIPWKGMKRFQLAKCMCVQDPFMLNFNVAANVIDTIAMKFQIVCQSTVELLDSMLGKSDSQSQNTNKINIMDMFCDTGLPTRSKDLRKLLEISFPDVLNTVISRSSRIFESTGDLQRAEHPSELDSRSSYSEVIQNQKETDSIDRLDSLMPMMPGEKFKVNMTFEIHEVFKDYCMKHFHGLNISDEDQHRTMKILWLTYIADFFTVIWRKGYSMTMEESKKPFFFIPLSFNSTLNKERFTQSVETDTTNANQSTTHYQNIKIPLVTGPKKRKSSVTDGIEHENKSEQKISKMGESFYFSSEVVQTHNPGLGSSNLHITESENFHEDSYYESEFNLKAINEIIKIKDKLGWYSKIPEGVRKSCTTVYTLTGDKRLWIGRENVWKKRINSLMERNINEHGYNTNTLPLDLNPFTFEENITKTMSLLNGINKSIHGDVTFQCTLSIETATPKVYIELEQTISDDDQAAAVIDFIKSVFNVMIPQYALFRLYKS